MVAVFPSASSSVRAPSDAIRKPEIELLPVFVVYVKRPFLVTTTQHAAVSVVATFAVIGVIVPFLARSYDESTLASGAPPKASETIRSPRLSNANPKGVTPADGCAFGAPARPCRTL